MGRSPDVQHDPHNSPPIRPFKPHATVLISMTTSSTTTHRSAIDQLANRKALLTTTEAMTLIGIKRNAH
jgi:hypothetical protein